MQGVLVDNDKTLVDLCDDIAVVELDISSISLYFKIAYSLQLTAHGCFY